MTQEFSTFTSQQFLDPTKGLNNLSDLIAVLEELQIEENSEHWNTLLDSSRYLVNTENVELRLNTKEAKLKACKLYYFNDMFIIGQYRKQHKKGTLNSAKSDKVVFGNLIGRKNSDLSEESGDEGAGKEKEEKKSVVTKASRSASMSSANTVSQKLRIKLWMDLDHVDVKQIEDGGEFGIRCFCTLQTTKVDEETGDDVYVTEVQQVQFFFIDKVERDRIFGNLVQAIDHVLEEQMTNSKSSGSFEESTQADTNSVVAESVNDSDSEAGDEGLDLKQRTMRKMMNNNTISRVKSKSSVHSADSGSTNGSKRRGYSKGKETMRKMKSNRNKKKTSTGGADSISGMTMSSVHSDLEAPLTLEDLVEKYKVVLSPENEDQTAEFKVSFGYGGMGFALSSTKSEGEGFGVFVGRLESGGMAEAGGVTLGDRVLKIAGVDVKDGMTWQDCIELIKQKRLEKDANGKPKSMDIVFARAKSVEENVSKKFEEDKKRKIRERVKKRNGRRAWTKNKSKSFGSRMATLDDIKSLYEKRNENDVQQENCDRVFDILLQNEQSEAGKKCAYILKEIHDTEKQYLSSLYVLIDKYQKPLLKKKVEMPCKELSTSVTKFCEHGTPKIMCNKMSSVKVPIMTKAESKAMFGNVELLVKVNESLMQSLQTGLVHLLNKHEKSGEDITVTDTVLVFAPVFSTIMPFFRMYSQYAFQYSNSLEMLNIMKEKEAFRTELNRIESKKDNMSLNSLLIKPISRLCKYPLLFDTLANAMGPYIKNLANDAIVSGTGNVDKLDRCVTELMEAKRMVANIAESVDLKVGENHDLERLSEIYVELGGHHGVKQFMVPSRRFIHKYDCFVEDKVKKLKTKPILIYLFNDLVIFAQEKKGTGLLAQLDKMSTKKKGTFETIGKTLPSDTKSRVSRTSKARSSVKNSRNNSLTKATQKQAVNVKKQIKIDRVTVRKKAVENKEGMFGISFTETERKSKTKKKEQSTSIKEDAAATPEETETFINRYDIWCVTEEERDEIMTGIQEQVTKEKENRRNKAKASAIIKPELKKRQRAWKAKAVERRRNKEGDEGEALGQVERLNKEKRKSQFVQMDIKEA